MLDLGMARIIAECMDKYYSGQGSEVSVATQKVAQDDPLHINSPEGQPMYAYKIKQFLLAFALGMTVSSPWDGCFNANGGYIVVKKTVMSLVASIFKEGKRVLNLRDYLVFCLFVKIYNQLVSAQKMRIMDVVSLLNHYP